MKIFTLNFWQQILERFFKDGCLYRASALTVSTLMALVPLTTIVLALLSFFPFMKGVGENIQSFIVVHFVPETGKIVYSYLLHFVKQAQQLSYVGFITFTLAAFFLIKTVEQTFNHIWRDQKKHFRGYKVKLIHWTLLLLLPIFMTSLMMLILLIYSIPAVSEGLRVLHMESVLLNLFPFLCASVAFTALYFFLPKPTVRFRHALLSGIFCAFLLEMIKWGLSLYLSYFPIYKAIYGALYVLPLFLLWVDLSWIVVLFGAELCYELGLVS